MAKASVARIVAPKGPVVIDCIQGTDEWHRAKIGIPSASNFATIMANGKDGSPSITRAKLMHRLAGEIIMDQPAPEGYRNAAMDRGNAIEAEARESYARRKKVEPQLVGFVKNFEGLKHCGASPDALLGFDGGLEIKSAEASVLIPLLDRPQSAVTDHRAQIQGNMMVCDRSWWMLTIYCHPLMPALDIPIERSDSYIAELSEHIQKFNYELKKLVERLRNMGAAG